MTILRITKKKWSCHSQTEINANLVKGKFFKAKNKPAWTKFIEETIEQWCINYWDLCKNASSDGQTPQIRQDLLSRWITLEGGKKAAKNKVNRKENKAKITTMNGSSELIKSQTFHSMGVSLINPSIHIAMILFPKELKFVWLLLKKKDN